MSNVKYITVVFENCESLTFKYPEVSAFVTGDITKSFSSYSNCIGINQSTSGFSMVISKEAKPESFLFSGQGTISNPSEVSRLEWCDVTQISVTFDDDAEEYFMIKWLVGDETQHSGQKFITTPEGNYLFYSETEGYKNAIDVYTADIYCSMANVL